ncbi:hypothetical protein MASR2M15_22630 [Anaerolineales bacterium]
MHETIAVFEARRAANNEVLAGIPPDTLIYAEGGWTLKDLLSHMIAWERTAIDALVYYQRGEEYIIAEFATTPTAEAIEAFNQRMYLAHRDDPVELVWQTWDEQRAAYINTLTEAYRLDPQTKINQPWVSPLDGDAYVSLEGLMKSINWHEKEHIQDIQKVKESLGIE